ncbi:MAG: methionine--tRNA ligase subunit beta, partial [Nitrospira sp.]|nr:methionine--tRNA ligase subunit beta [Nitrospira sp.]
EGVIPEPSLNGSHVEEGEVKEIALELFNPIEDAFNHLEFHRALSEIWKLVDRTNRYIEQMAPWNLVKKAREQRKLTTVLYTAAEALRHIARYLAPFMPRTSEKIIWQLGIDSLPPDALNDHSRFSSWGGNLPIGSPIRKEPPLFPRIDKPGLKTLTSQPTTTFQTSKTQISIEDFSRLDLRVGKVLSAERVSGSEKLLKLIVDIGAEQRQIVAGMAKRYPPEDLIHKKVIVVVNLKPAKMMGVESQGMILAAGDKEVAALATFLEDVEPGTTIR